MVRFRLYANKDEETAYLNEMAARGYAMTGFFAGFYSFEKCWPGEFIYQVDITEGWFRVSSDYREFMQEMGVGDVGDPAEESGGGPFRALYGCGVRHRALYEDQENV